MGDFASDGDKMSNRQVTTATRAWHPWGATLFAITGVLAVFTLPGAKACLQYDRVLIGQGQWWRMLTSHWVHWTADHLLWDLMAFAALALCALRIAQARAVGTLITASILIPITLWLFQPEMIYYRGLSGLASALYVFVVVDLAAKARRDAKPLLEVVSWCMLLGFSAKVIFELATGQTLFVQSMGANVQGVPLAHLAGGIVGGGFAMGADFGSLRSHKP